MAARRPLVLVNGRTKELPAADVAAGVPVFLRVGLRTGTVVSIPLSTSYTFTIGLRAGGTVAVQATLT